MTQKKTVELVVGQHKLSLKTDRDPKEVMEVADLVNKRLEEILPFNQPLSHQVLLILALNLAEDLINVRSDLRQLKGEVRQRSQTLLAQLEREFPV